MKKWIITGLIVAVVLLGWNFQDDLVRAYVSLSSDLLENYAVSLLEAGEQGTDRYGLWKTSCYPDRGMVQFHTGGWGLAPGSSYKGFYYAADNAHKVFSAAYGDTIFMETNGDHATWTDGTDNHGRSVRLFEQWFWFEASF